MESLLKDVGSCGLFQVKFVLATRFLTIFICSWSMMLMTFGNYNPGWACLDKNNGSYLETNTSDFFVNYNISLINNSSLNLNYNSTCSDDCTSFKFQPEASTIVTEWALICKREWISNIIISLQMASIFVGSLIGAQAGDMFGRKFDLYGGNAIQTIGNIVAYFSVSWEMFAAARSVIGLGIGLTFCVSQAFPSEFLDHKMRPALMGIPFWNFFMCIFALVVYLLRDWRHVTLITIGIGALSLLPALWTPESMRWLAVKGKTDKAFQVAKQIAANNKKPEPSKKIIIEVAKIEKDLHDNKDVSYTFLDLFKKPLWWRSLGSGIIWMLFSVIYFSISFGIKTLSGSFYLNLFLFALAGVPTVMMVPVASRFFGRRWGSISFLIFTILACFLVFILRFAITDDEIHGRITMILALLAIVLLDAGWYLFGTMNLELFPTVVRTLGSGYFNAVARLGAIIAPFVIPASKETAYIYYGGMGLVTAMCSGIILSLPETAGKDMTEFIEEENIRKQQTNEETREMNNLIE